MGKTLIRQFRSTGVRLCLVARGSSDPRHCYHGLLVLLWLSFFGCADEVAVDETLLVTAGDETWAGNWVDQEAGIASFLGVPYAAPPVGDLRWKPPAATPPRSGIRVADRFAARCPQSADGAGQARELARDFGGDPDQVPPLGETSEDCLYLNIWTPGLSGEVKLPVMVWIHGGSNRWGGGDEMPYDGSALARRGIVVVTLNYRLGLLGFLAHPALSVESEHRSSGNYGLLDQIAALGWVQRNIETFGGDPERVTVFGGSAGGADALYLLASPLSAGLFHRVIAQSGAPPADTRSLAGQEQRGVRLGELLELQDSTDVLADLRAVPAERLLELGADHLNEEFDCAPVRDGWALPDLPGRIFAAGKQHDVPLIVGSNADEWTTIGRYSQPVTARGFEGWLASRWGGLTTRAAALYPAATTEQVAVSLARWQTDYWFTCPARFVAKSTRPLSSSAYLYEFTHPAPSEGGSSLGAYHGAEVAFVFDNLAAESWIPRGPSDEQLSSAMADYWVQFASTGDPNLEGRPGWPPFDGAGSYLEFGDEITLKRGLRETACALWEIQLERQLDLRR